MDDSLQNERVGVRREIDSPSDVPEGLWFASTMTRGMSQLFNMASAEPPFNEEALKGIGYVLEAVADDLDIIRQVVENAEGEVTENFEDDTKPSFRAFEPTSAEVDKSAFAAMMQEFTKFLHERRNHREQNQDLPPHGKDGKNASIEGDQ